MNELKQEILMLIGFLQERDYSIRKLSRILFAGGIFKVQTWQSLKEKVSELPNNSDLLNKIKDILKGEYNRSLHFGKKAVVFFDISTLSETELAEFEDKLKQVIDANSSTAYAQTFPNLLPKNVLEEQSTQLVCVRCQLGENGSLDKFWVCGRNFFRKRREFILGEAPEDVQEYFREFDGYSYDEIIAIRKDFKQLVSYFTVDKDNKILTLYSDTTAITSQSDMDYLSESLFRYLLNIFPALVSAKKKNIGNSIRALYDEEVGRITSFSHYTDSGSVKHEKLDRKNSKEDLRLEPYHASGMVTIQSQTEFHAIEKKWKSISQNDLFEPTISLSYKNFLEGTTRISVCYVVEIDDCACQEDLDLMTKKIFEFS